MNTNAFSIKVNTLNNSIAYIFLDHITAIVQSEADENTCEIRTVGNCCYFTNASADEVYTAIQGLFPVIMEEAPEIGFPKIEAQQEVEKDEVDGLDENGLNPVQREIADMVDRVPNFSRCRDVHDILAYTAYIKVAIGNGDGEDYTDYVTDIRHENGSVEVRIGEGKWSDICMLDDGDQEKILGELKGIVRWESVYEWIVEDVDVYDCSKMYNAAQGDDLKKHLLLNTEENIDKFGLTAGELMKSMVDGHYHKDHEYIFMYNGELFSTNDPCAEIDFVSLTDWLLEHIDYARDVMPEKVFNTVFE